MFECPVSWEPLKFGPPLDYHLDDLFKTETAFRIVFHPLRFICSLVGFQ